MFTKVRLKNFKSFSDITFDISDNKRSKNLVVLYGKNGSGKSNVMSAFVFLNELIVTMNVRDRYEAFLAHEEELKKINDENISMMLRQQFLDGLRNIKSIIDDYKMIDSNGNIVAEYNFVIDDKAGIYSIELDDNEIISEKLEFVLNKRKGVYFQCSKGKYFINNAIIKDTALMDSVKQSTYKYWGKHSILAILIHEIDDKAKSFAENNFSDNLNLLLDHFRLMSSSLSVGQRRWHSLCTKFPIAFQPVNGSVQVDREKELEKFADIFSKVFYYTNSKINRLYYKKVYQKSNIEYELFERKLIDGRFIDIPFERESTGNHKLLDFFCNFINAALGQIVILDEADAGIHELQFKNLLEALQPYITGQLIMTVHNTFLMELKDARKFTYIIDDTDKIKIRSINDYDKRTFANNNIRIRYLSGKYKGIPENANVDFGLIFKELE